MGSLPGGGTPDYSSVSTWEADSDNDLSGYSGPVILDCYDSQDHINYIHVTIDGATNTSETAYRCIQSSQNCRNTWAGKVGTGTNFVGTQGFAIAEAYATIMNICVEVADNYFAQNHAIEIFGGYESMKILNCVAKCTNAGSGTGYGYGIGDLSMSQSWLVYNCIALSCKNDGFHATSYGETALAGIVNCTSIGNGGKGFNLNYYAGTVFAFNCYAEDNTDGDFIESGWSVGSGWNASKDNTSDLGGSTVNYKNGLDLISSGELDQYALATSEYLCDAGGVGNNYGRNPYNDLSMINDFWDFLKNDTSGNTISKKDIAGYDRPTPDTAGASWNVGASQLYVEPVPVTSSQPICFVLC